MADEKKPGLLKRMFSFGFGKKKAEVEVEVEDNSAVEAKAQAAQDAAAQAEAERLAAEKQAQEDAARLQAQEEANALAEKEAEAKHLAEEEAARLEAERVEAERIKAEEAAKAKAAAEEQAAKDKADAEEAARLELQAAKEVERLEAERKAVLRQAEDEAKALAEKERLEALAVQQAKDEADRKALEEQVAKEEADRLEQERLEAEAKQLAEQQAKEEALLRQAQDDADRIEAERLEQERLKAEQEAILREAQDEAASDQGEDDAEDEQEAERKVGWFKRLTKGLARSSSALTENITSVFTKKKLDEDTLQELEDILIQADLGVETAMNITDTLASQRMGKDVSDEEVRQIMADEIEKVLKPVAQPLELDLDHQPHVILVVGVNGSGKTTTIGKISQKLYNAGFSTLLVAGDTFRAAAVEQLHIWGDRTQAPVMSRPNGSDAAGLAYDAYTEAVEQKRDVMLMDTAGRLQNKKELMDELEKIIRVLKKQDPSAPHTVLLTLDATTGQNALNQVEIFKDVAGVNGLVMTKLDGTARGGILVSISAKHKLPVYFIGVGEQVEDLEPFEADVFAKAIAGISDE